MKFLAWACLMAAPMAVGAVTFTHTFDGLTPGAATELSTSGLPINLTRLAQPGHSFTVEDVQLLGAVASWGTQAILPAPTTADPMVVNLDQLIGRASIEFADFGRDDDTVFLEAYSGIDASGTLLGSASVLRPTALEFGNVQTLELTGLEGARSLRFWSIGEGGTNSLYWDNLTLTVVPEPGTIAALALGTAWLARRRRR